MSSNSTAFNNDSAFPRLKGACNACLREIKSCKYCGTMLNWLDRKPIEYRSGNYHRCPCRNKNRGRGY